MAVTDGAHGGTLVEHRGEGDLLFAVFARAADSVDGETWFRCGEVAFPADDPVWVGMDTLMGMVGHYDWVRVLGRDSR